MSENDIKKRIVALSPKRSLFDEDDKSGYKEYKAFLEEAFSNNNIKNIAVTGNFGVGKSSIIRSFEAQDPNKQDGYLYISLADFSKKSKRKSEEENEANQNSEKNSETQQEFERYLLCQVLSRSNASIMPYSSYKLIPREHNKVTKILFAILVSLLFICWFLIVKQSAFKFDNQIRLSLHWILAILATMTVAIVVYYLISFIKSTKINIEYKNIKLETAAKLPTTGSYIDDNMFEIVYALEQLSKSIGYTVVLEDFDRLGSDICIDIFSKMRRINYLINDRHIIKKHMRFIYAFDDAVFKQTRDTKFFDYILSVTPQLNYANAGKVLKRSLFENALMLEDSNNILSILSIYSDKFWNLVGLVVNDYRTMNHIQNEFSLFIRILTEKKIEVDEKCLPYIIYKNVMPDDYSDGLKRKTILEIEKEARIKRIDLLYEQYGTTYVESLKSLMNHLIDVIGLSGEDYNKFTGSSKESLAIRYSFENNLSIKTLLEYKVFPDNENIGIHLENKNILITINEFWLGFELLQQLQTYKVNSIFAITTRKNIYDELRKLGMHSVKIALDNMSMDKTPIDYFDTQPDVIIHTELFVANSPEKTPMVIVRDCLLRTYRLITRSIELGVPRFLLCSRVSGRGDDLDINYQVGSLLEKIALSMSNQTTVIETVSLSGSEASYLTLIQIFKKQIKRGGPVTITHQDMIRYLSPLSKVCQKALKALFMDDIPNIYKFDIGTPYKILTLAEYMIEELGYSTDQIPIDITGLRPGEKLYEETFNIPYNLIATSDDYIYNLTNQYDLFDASTCLNNIERVLLYNHSDNEIIDELDSTIRATVQAH